MKDKHMEQKLFEELIAPYTRLVVDEENPALTHFELIRHPRKTTYHKGVVVNGGTHAVKTGRSYQQVVTPAGKFESVVEAADHYGTSVSTMYSRIKLHKNRTKKEYYLDGE